jgi:hypothetical protein
LQAHRQLIERANVTGELIRPDGEREPTVRISQIAGGHIVLATEFALDVGGARRRLVGLQVISRRKGLR